MANLLKISILIFLVLGIFTGQAFAIVSIYVDSFDIFEPVVHTNGNGENIGGTSYGPTNDGGVSVVTFALPTSSASNSGWDCFLGKFVDFSSAQEYQFWQMHAHLIGDPAEEAEIIADWEFWSQPMLYTYVSNPLLSYASAYSSSYMNGYAYGVNKDGYFNEFKEGYSDVYYEALDEQEAEFFEVKGNTVEETGSFSLGTFLVEEPNYFTIMGYLGVHIESYVTGSGSAASSLMTTHKLTLRPEMKGGPEPTPTPTVPEPSTLLLLGIGILPLRFILSCCNRKSY